MTLASPSPAGTPAGAPGRQEGGSTEAPEQKPPVWFLGRFLWWTALFALVALPLGWGFDQLLIRFEEGWKDTHREELLTRADHLLAALERRLAPLYLVQRALTLFQKRFQLARFDSATLGRLESRFCKRFPATATRFWFDAEGRLLLPPGAPAVTGTKVWQSFFRYLDRPQVSPPEQLLAENLLRNSLGTMVDRSMLRDGFRSAIEVVFNGQLNFFRVLEFRDPGGKRVGSLMLFLPRSHLPRGWELFSAMRSLGGQNRFVGGYWQSRSSGRGTGELSPNLLHGLFTALSAGSASIEHAGTLFRSRLYPNDPDFMMTVGIRASRWQDRAIPDTLLLLRRLNWCIIAVTGLLCLFLGLGRLVIDPPLHLKFLYGTALLSLPPLLALVLLGWIQSEIMQRNTRIDRQRVLEAELYRFEQAFADHLIALSEKIHRLLKSPILIAGTDEKAIRASFNTLRGEGMVRFSLVHANGLRLTHGLQRRNIQGRQMEDAVLNKFLDGSGMKLDNRTSAASDPTGLSFIFEGNDQRQLWHGLDGAFGTFNLGPMSWYIFNGFALDAAGSQAAYLFLGFDTPRVNQIFLKRSSEQRVISQPFEFFTSRTPPRSTALRALLHSASTRQSPVFSSFRAGESESVALARPLRGLNLSGVIHLDVPAETTIIPTQRFSLLILLTAAATALFAAGLLRRKFLEPIEHLASCVERLDQGDFLPTAAPVDRDELGALATAFNSLAEGLRQKSAMAAFVRPDLASEALRRSAGQVARRRVTVLFAGLRRFSELEQTLAPRVALALMSRFLGICDTACRANSGMIDKFIGDSAMGVFLDAPADAVAAAVALRHAATELMAERARRDLPTLRFGIGIATGEAVTGDIGSRRKRLDFTVIGDTVNLAARLEKQAGHPEGPVILAVGEFGNEPPAGHRWVPAAIDTVRGRKGTLAIQALIEEKRHG